MSKRLYKYDDFVAYQKANEAAAAEQANEGTLSNIAMAAATAAGLAGAPATAAAATTSGHETSITANQQGERPLPPGTVSVYVTRAQIDNALTKLEHRKQFKMKFVGDKSSIIGIGQYDYPVYKSGSTELAKYNEALHGAKTSTEKFFWANGLVYANPYVDTSGVDKTEIMTPPPAVGAALDATPAAAATPAASDDGGRVVGNHKATIQDISSFVVKAQGIWDFRAKGGQLSARVNGREVTYTNKNEFVKDFVVVNYKLFVRDKFGETVDDQQIIDLMDNAISRVGE